MSTFILLLLTASVNGMDSNVPSYKGVPGFSLGNIGLDGYPNPVLASNVVS